jgi:hypothetical protein
VRAAASQKRRVQHFWIGSEPSAAWGDLKDGKWHRQRDTISGPQISLNSSSFRGQRQLWRDPSGTRQVEFGDIGYSMSNVILFEDAMKKAGGKDCSLLLGNGFSARYFNYRSLLEKADLRI